MCDFFGEVGASFPSEAQWDIIFACWLNWRGQYCNHHVPPKTGSGVSGEESEAAGLLSAYLPDYFVSGHDHTFPYKPGQSWNQKTGEVCVLVPGQLMSAPFPNHIKLDTQSGERSWHTNRRHGCQRTSVLNTCC